MRVFAPLAVCLLLAACGEGKPLLPADARLPDGGQYRGTIVDGLLQGQGRVDYPNGSWYAGTFKDGQWNGNGEWHGPNGEVYRGEFSQGLFEGQGTLTTATTTYTGSFKRGKREGEGTLKAPGRNYRGGFQNDQYAGAGHLDMDDGSVYQGDFERGQPNGEGVRTDADGNQFSGHFVDGQLEGHGTFSNGDGDQYIGDFHHGRLEGHGRYETQAGDVWIGQFKDGAPNGPGDLFANDGSHYQGDFVDWHFQGEGQLASADGSLYTGGFANDAYQGKGTLVVPGQAPQAGYWAEGRRVRDEHDRALPDPLEQGLLVQGALLDRALNRLPNSSPAIELYSLTLGGDGEQSVFMREADYVHDLLATRFGAVGGVTLVNHRDHLTDRAMATRETLARSVQAIAQRSGPEDLVFIYLTSHGTSEHELVLEQPRLQLSDISGQDLAALLAPLKDRDKVVVVSACYSGGFIEPLKNDRTLVITASRPDRVSFGCSEEADFTYFGDALFAQALTATDDLQVAFQQASSIVAQREQAENFEASEPQMWAPKGVLTHWHRLRQQQASAALHDSSNNSPSKLPARH
ncbi:MULTISPECIES: C13 family peptidase [Pseudomonas]|uniref:Peptidase C13 n=1 Tax=Pseudomonas quercus TaxID=2722792 RepID=A0ABX0YGM4_9PSED|nr:MULTISPECIES: C13 family peptidase [Pseudomonas]MBF7144000.1 peptidase C13 [Pseudomonas sp. LY10J]NJP02540.1 peptidase C13 [Pseudomonas quercus]